MAKVLTSPALSCGVSVGDPLMTAAQLQAEFGVAESTWRYWHLRGEGPPSFKLGRRRVWRRSAVLAWIAARESG